MKSFFEKLKQNRGAGMIIVVLAIVFLTAFGTLAMTMSYTSFEMSVAERQGKEAGYNAEAAMEQIRCGIQTAASEAMTKTYNKVLRDYTYNAGNIKDQFQLSFVQFFKDYEVGASGDKLVDDSGSGAYIYNSSTLEGMIEEERGGVARVNEDGTSPRTIVYNDVTRTYTFKEIQVSYTSPNGRKSKVTADIDVRIPDIGYILTQYALSGIPEHCLIVRGRLYHGENNQRVQLRGDAYCGNVELTGLSEFVTSNNMTFVVGDTISFNQSKTDKARFQQHANTTLWAKNIDVKSASKIDLKGKTYVRNDLNISGNSSKVRISGEYVGFGTGTDPLTSSSIIVNGMSNILDLEGSTVTLGGVAYIGNELVENPLGIPYSNAVPMGESISVKSNQKAFLVPEGHLERYMYIVGFEGDGVKYKEVTITLTNSIVHSDARAFEDSTGHYTFKISEADAHGNITWVTVPPMEIAHVVPNLIGPISVTSSIEVLTFNELEDFAYYKIKGEHWEWVFEEGTYKWKFISPSNEKVKGLSKTYSDYTITLKKVSIPLDANHTAMYLFMIFEDENKRSEFFEDYFMANPSVINSYIKKHIDNTAYSDLRKPSYIPPRSLDSVGIVMGEMKHTELPLDPWWWGVPTDPNETGNFYIERGVADTIRTMCDFMLQVFETFRKTLSNVGDDTVPDNMNPYDYYIREELILGDESAGIEGLFPSGEDGALPFFVGNEDQPSGLVVKGNFDTNDLPTVDGVTIDIKKLRIIIVTGDAYIRSNYEGLLFVGGNLNVMNSVIFRRDAPGVSNTFEADSLKGKDAIGDYRIKSFIKGDILNQHSESESATGEAWNIENLVCYSKWKKN